MDRDIVVVCNGPSKMKMVVKSSDGRVEEWTMEACPKGLCYTATDRNSGQTCKLVMERFVNIFGKARLISTVGMEEFLKAMGKQT